VATSLVIFKHQLLPRCELKKRKGRNQGVTVHFNEPTAVNGIMVHHDGQVEFLKDDTPLTPDRARVDVWYDRPKGPKILTRTSASGSRWPSHPHQTLGNADLIYWVDTNSREVDGQWIHATAVILGEPRHVSSKTYIKYQIVHGFEIRGSVSKPERLAWCEVIERLRMNPYRLLNWNVYLIVDSDLSALSDINASRAPIWNDYALPPRFQFVYASADVGMDQPLNAVMARCDRKATQLLDQIIRNDASGSGVKETTLVGRVPMRRWDPLD
jgi:hypothetical protein